MSTSPQVITPPQQLQQFCLDQKHRGQKIGVVPTMGALHAGHLSLVDRMRSECDLCVVTIFVNPTQFGPGEDFDKYPRTLEQDLDQLTSHHVDLVFAPETGTMFPADATTQVQPPRVAETLEGPLRPGHFQGVATVVLKLLNLTLADVAIFGQKDFQQLAVLKQMANDLNVATRILSAPIVRESDGLAMSSRNRYLDAEERQRALALSRSLFQVRQQFDEGQRDARDLAAELMQGLIDGGVDSADYAVIADAITLESLETVDRPAVALVAAHVGQTRLIDNLLLTP